MTGTKEQTENRLIRLFRNMLKRAIKDFESAGERGAIKKGGY